MLKKMLYLGATTATALVLTVAPAGAIAVPPETGVGLTLTGNFNSYAQINTSPLAPLPLCITSDSQAILTLHNTGTFSAGLGNIFLGETVTTVTIASGALHFNPAGTFSDASCTVPAFGPVLGIPATVTVASVSGNGTVSCSGGTATYGRLVEVGLVSVLNPSCTVNGITTSPTLLQFNGAQQPCFPDGPLPVDPCALVPEWVGTYTQT